ncbi:MAG: glutamine--fructose-6-phosphate transaminase (isomerizing) [Sulfolobales archaeon]|nr:glutamine--fructose-6-phosphate transaminase (isomerizing) [Sulfolobales archaeon]MCX8199444.1 glutamine--fructose-6-phosphate transaminase (isomerizing) [Sulfolobales archaeon]MDW8170241.1 glutamine--fructose-6-phosphate transaminase (isomerizing) [Desulfurococcaceae archaeon]
MGGIFGAISHSGRNIASIVLTGLKRLKHRGFDTTGVAFIDGGRLSVLKEVGEPREVIEKLKLDELSMPIALGHVRFSTHGRPHVDNAHPHLDCSKRIAVVGDGAIANYEAIYDRLIMDGHELKSRSDFEVIAHLIEDGLRRGLSTLESIAVMEQGLEGFYSYAILSEESKSIIAYTSLQPLYIGRSRDLTLVSTSKSALHGLADEYVELSGGELAEVNSSTTKFYKLHGLMRIDKCFSKLSVLEEYVEKDGYPHHMLREMYEVPYAILRCLAVHQEKYLSYASKHIREAKDVYIIANGTSLHAGLVASYYLSELANISPIVTSAAEFPLYYIENVGPGAVVVAISQSGETSDVVQAAYEAKLRGATIMGLTNYVGSKLANIANLYLPIGAGPELAVPATKTFVTTLTTLYKISIRVARDMGRITASEYGEALSRVKDYALKLKEGMAEVDAEAAKAADEIASCRSGYVVSRGITYPIALEGALKIKEVAYMHAEGMEAGEFRHGPISLVERGFFTVFLVPVEAHAARASYPLIKASIDLGATVAVVGFENDPNLFELKNVSIIKAMQVDRYLAPIAYTIPLQFLAYRLGLKLQRPIDKPRYLTKAVS